MKTYTVFAIATAQKYLGEVQASSQEEADKLAEEMFSDTCWIMNNVSNDFEIGDTDMVVEES